MIFCLHCVCIFTYLVYYSGCHHAQKILLIWHVYSINGTVVSEQLLVIKGTCYMTPRRHKQFKNNQMNNPIDISLFKPKLQRFVH